MSHGYGGEVEIWGLNDISVLKTNKGSPNKTEVRVKEFFKNSQFRRQLEQSAPSPKIIYIDWTYRKSFFRWQSIAEFSKIVRHEAVKVLFWQMGTSVKRSRTHLVSTSHKMNVPHFTSQWRKKTDHPKTFFLGKVWFSRFGSKKEKRSNINILFLFSGSI